MVAQLARCTYATIAWIEYLGTTGVEFDDAIPGTHDLRPRATHGTGAIQTPEEHDPLPRGATGYHRATSGTWAATGSLSVGRTRHTATLLGDGRVLVAGGFDAANNVLASAELYDPPSGNWSATGRMTTAHNNHAATLLADGRVWASMSAAERAEDATLAELDSHAMLAGRGRV